MIIAEPTLQEDEVKEATIIHILRNPYGHSEERVREARLAAADLIAGYADASLCMREFVDEQSMAPEISNYFNEGEL